MPGTLLLFLLTSTDAMAAPMGQIALPGQYHGDEMPVNADNDWIGLYAVGNGFAWKPVTPQFRSAMDPVLDQPGQETGVEVEVSGERPLLMVRGVEALKAGPIKKAKEERTRMTVGTIEALSDELSLVAAMDDDGVYQLRIEDKQGHTQVLCAHTELYDETVPTLIMAGDLDGDGRLDLLIDTSNHYNLSRVTLFLSSSAGPGEWVAPVATLQTTGC